MSNSVQAARGAILRRIMTSHVDLLVTHGPQKVMDAVDCVAEGLDNLEEIGTSDVSCWVKSVEEILK